MSAEISAYFDLEYAHPPSAGEGLRRLAQLPWKDPLSIQYLDELPLKVEAHASVQLPPVGLAAGEWEAENHLCTFSSAPTLEPEYLDALEAQFQKHYPNRPLPLFVTGAMPYWVLGQNGPVRELLFRRIIASHRSMDPQHPSVYYPAIRMGLMLRVPGLPKTVLRFIIGLDPVMWLPSVSQPLADVECLQRNWQYMLAFWDMLNRDPGTKYCELRVIGTRGEITTLGLPARLREMFGSNITW